MPPLTSVAAFALASLAIVAVPGPSVLFTVGRALSAGRRVALLTVLGNAGGILTQIVAIAVGLGPLVASSAAVYSGLKAVGAGYLVWLGVQSVRHRRALAGSLHERLAAVRATRAVRAGYLVGVTNPKSLVFFMALLPQFVDRSGPVAPQLLVLGAVFVVVALAMDGSVALAAARCRDWFASSPRRLERVGGAGGLMMVGLGAGLLVTGRSD
ncbi:LysE family translocator [Phycicoccus endophyticus]|uniref:LysE family translocator n=1 Tax=Phycicoccus endophyticus TaxID=1690220 RepID=A0A7G9R1A7_9MICO|nr:LysE family translocator [Phycicoccus endophyticus]NHI18843.1 LysE family translocator [Phycicoccus endophyticus]QNN49382.1 LysE family translocator [Phycicoccus endophyticus]GGL36088.1 lysine transporter LysE [Phycicoccus endophyticus]